MPHVCRCGGEGWDGCDPERQAIERRKAALHQRVVAALAGLDLRPWVDDGDVEAEPLRATITRKPSLALPSPEPVQVIVVEGEQLHVRTRP